MKAEQGASDNERKRSEKMKVSELLGQKLKSPGVMDLLETHDVDVIYDFDRTYENLPDAYWAPLEEKGIQLKFDESQILEVIFVYRKEKEGFSVAAFDFSGIESLIHTTK